MTYLKELAKLLLSTAKTVEDEPSALLAIEGMLNELKTAQVNLAIAIVQSQATEWGDVARTTKFMCNEIVKKLSEHLKG